MPNRATIEYSPEAIAEAIRRSYTGEIEVYDQTLRTREIFIGFSALQGEQPQWSE